jgi:hypothetical protein
MLKLVGTTWQWTKSTDSSGKETKVNQPDKYTLQFFSADGKVGKGGLQRPRIIYGRWAQLTLSLDPLTLTLAQRVR